MRACALFCYTTTGLGKLLVYVSASNNTKRSQVSNRFLFRFLDSCRLVYCFDLLKCLDSTTSRRKNKRESKENEKIIKDKNKRTSGWAKWLSFFFLLLLLIFVSLVATALEEEMVATRLH